MQPRRYPFMARLYRYFFRGLITALPIVLTLYFLFIFLAWTERAALSFIGPFIGGFYIPGMGLLLGVLGIVLIGYLVSKQRVQRVFYFLEFPFTNIPVVKSIYSSLKSFADYFTPNAKSDTQPVVVLRIPGQPLELVGLITRRNTEGLPAGFLQGDRVAVYLPMGYMIGGYTVFVPADWVQPIDMSVEEAMRASLIAWMARAPGEPPIPPATPSEVKPEPDAPAPRPATTEAAPDMATTTRAAAPAPTPSADGAKSL